MLGDGQSPSERQSRSVLLSNQLLQGAQNSEIFRNVGKNQNIIISSRNIIAHSSDRKLSSPTGSRGDKRKSLIIQPIISGKRKSIQKDPREIIISAQNLPQNPGQSSLVRAISRPSIDPARSPQNSLDQITQKFMNLQQESQQLFQQLKRHSSHMIPAFPSNITGPDQSLMNFADPIEFSQQQEQYPVNNVVKSSSKNLVSSQTGPTLNPSEHPAKM